MSVEYRYPEFGPTISHAAKLRNASTTRRHRRRGMIPTAPTIRVMMQQEQEKEKKKEQEKQRERLLRALDLHEGEAHG